MYIQKSKEESGTTETIIPYNLCYEINSSLCNLSVAMVVCKIMYMQLKGTYL